MFNERSVRNKDDTIVNSIDDTIMNIYAYVYFVFETFYVS